MRRIRCDYSGKEGAVLAREFLADKDFSEELIDRVSYLVGHHHTLTEIDGIDYQILVEADYFVNAFESKYSEKNVRNMREKIFKTETGKHLLENMFLGK